MGVMVKKKKIYNSKTIRISLGDYALLSEVSQRAGITFAEALHLVITDRARQAESEPVAIATKPAFKVPVARVALRYASQPAIATNGSKAAAFRIKPKGVSYGATPKAS